MKIVAIKDMSAGNEFVGEMWQETKIFEGTEPIENIVQWANSYGKLHRVTITIPDGESIPKKEKFP